MTPNSRLWSGSRRVAAAVGLAAGTYAGYASVAWWRYGRAIQTVNEPCVFGRNGIPIRTWRTCFKKACREAGP